MVKVVSSCSVVWLSINVCALNLKSFEFLHFRSTRRRKKNKKSKRLSKEKKVPNISHFVLHRYILLLVILLRVNRSIQDLSLI